MYVIKIIFFLLVFNSIIQSENIDFSVPIYFNTTSLNFNQNENIFIQKEDDWSLSIPKLNLKNIPIKDGIKNDILENYIGHFPISSYVGGNVCLAAHNAGYRNNYFSHIYLLENGDEIYYKYFNIEKVYQVNNICVINDNDFDFLDNNNQDKIFLITCIPNSPQQRLCVEAKVKE